MKRAVILIFALAPFLLVAQAWSDSTVESAVKTGGFKGMGASEGTVVKRVHGDKMWESSSMKFTGAFLSKVAGGGETLTITRLDKGVIWVLDTKNQTYTERAIVPFKKGEGSKPEREKAKMRVTKSEFTVKKTGASETINGFPCEEYLLTWLLEMEDLETKAQTRSTMNNHLWTTPETDAIRKASAEEREFYTAYTRKLGISVSPSESKQMGMEALAALSGVPPEEVEKGLIRAKEEMSKIQGFPIRSAVSWAVEGDKAAAGKEEGTSSEPASETPRSIGGLLGGLAGKITQRVAKEKIASSTGGKEGAPFFSSMHEVKSIQTDSVPAEVFEIPAGYTKK